MAMTPLETGVLGLIGAVTVAALVVEIPPGTPDKQAQEVVAEPSKLAVNSDGTKAWTIKVKVPDGGVELRKLVSPDCARRPRGAAVSTCQRVVAGKNVDQGDLNRIPITEAVGAGCELVACSVVLGEDAEISEDARLPPKPSVVVAVADAGAAKDAGVTSKDGGK